MPSSFAEREANCEYLEFTERKAELEHLRNQIQIKKSLLVFGPEGVGKSRLLQSFVESQPHAIYVAQMSSPREFLLALLNGLHSADAGIKIPENIAGMTSTSLKGIVHRALKTGPFLMVLDHLDGPSRVATGMIKDLHDFGHTPVIFASRSTHMEDIGAMRSLCALRSERIEIKNLPDRIALEFAQRHADRIQLRASNLDSILQSLVAWSNGNPGAILQMLKMAQLSRYRVGDHIKAHILYVDFRMGRR